MPGGGSTNTNTQTTNSGPWGPTQPYLKGAMNTASNLVDKNSGFHAFPGEGYVPFSNASNQALHQMSSISNQGNPLAALGRDFTGGLLGGSYNHDQSGYQGLMGQNPNAISQYGTGIASGQSGINVNSQLQGLMGQNANAIGQYNGGMSNQNALQNYQGGNQSAASQYGRGIASGAQGINTEGGYRSMLGSHDKDFDRVVQNTTDDLGDSISRQFGGASFGSGNNVDYLAREVGDASARMRSNNFQQNEALKRGLLGDISGVQGQNINNRLNAAGMMSGEQGQNLGRGLQLAGMQSGEQGQNLGRGLQAAGMLSGEQMGNRGQQAGILGQMGGFQGQNISNRLNAAGMLSGEQQQGFANQRGLLGDMSNLSQMDIQNRMGGLDRMDSVYNSQYLPSEKMLEIGGIKEGKAGEKLQSEMDKFQIQDMDEWDRLMQGYGMFSGTGAQGGRSQTVASQPTDIWSKLLGGGLLASQMFS